MEARSLSPELRIPQALFVFAVLGRYRTCRLRPTAYFLAQHEAFAILALASQALFLTRK